MVLNEFECQSPHNRSNRLSTLYGTIGSNPLQKESSWHVLFPETLQYFNLVDNSDPTKNEESIYQRHVAHNSNLLESNPVISIDAIDAFASLVSADELGCHYRSNSSFSDSSSEDLILTGDQLYKKHTSNTNHVSEDVYLHTELRNVETFDPCHFLEPEETECSIASQSGDSSASECNLKSFSTHKVSSMANPPIQVMHRDQIYDPQRIPPNVFARSDSLTLVEWSATSNDSLFSIHVGNASMSREQAILLSGELKSLGGLPKFGDVFIGDMKEIRKIAGLSKSGELSLHRPPIPNKMERSPMSSPITTTNKLSTDLHASNVHETKNEVRHLEEITMKDKIVVPSDMTSETLKISTTKDMEEQQRRAPSTHSSNVSLLSNMSEDSTLSFAFPLLNEDENNVLAKRYSPRHSFQQTVEVPKTKASRGKRCFSHLCFSCGTCSSCTHCSSCGYNSSCPSCKCCFPFNRWPSCSSCKSCCSCNCWPLCSSSKFSCLSCNSCQSCSCCSVSNCWPSFSSCKSCNSSHHWFPHSSCSFLSLCSSCTTSCISCSTCRSCFCCSSRSCWSKCC